MIWVPTGTASTRRPLPHRCRAPQIQRRRAGYRPAPRVWRTAWHRPTRWRPAAAAQARQPWWSGAGASRRHGRGIMLPKEIIREVVNNSQSRFGAGLIPGAHLLPSDSWQFGGGYHPVRLCCNFRAATSGWTTFGKHRTGFPIMPSDNPFKWRQFEPALILQCARWYLRYALSYRDLEDMMRERGLCVDHTTIYRWVQSLCARDRQTVSAIPEAHQRLPRIDETVRACRRGCGRLSTVASIPTAIPWISCCERRATGRRPSRSSARR